MRARHISIAGWNARSLPLPAAGALILLVGLLTGCSGDDGRNDGATAPIDGVGAAETAMAPPGLSDVEAALELRPEQVESLSDALGRWTGAHARSRGGRDWQMGEESPMRGFLAEMGGLLDTEQFVALAGLLAERRVEHRARMENHREGDRGECPGGRSGGRGRGGMHGGGRHGGIWSELDLSDEQHVALREAMEVQHTAMRELREELSSGIITEEEYREAVSDLHDQLDASLQEILTEEQYALYLELLCERQAAAAERRLERIGEGLDRRVEFLTAVLQLDEEQQQQVRSVFEAAQPEWEGLLGRLAACEIDRREAAAEGRVIMEGIQAAIRDVLTPDQIERLDAIRELMPRHRGRM